MSRPIREMLSMGNEEPEEKMEQILGAGFWLGEIKETCNGSK